MHTHTYNTIQYNTIQYNTIQYNTIQYNTIQYLESLGVKPVVRAMLPELEIQKWAAEKRAATAARKAGIILMYVCMYINV
jgi:hypothetical protein